MVSSVDSKVYESSVLVRAKGSSRISFESPQDQDGTSSFISHFFVFLAIVVNLLLPWRGAISYWLHGCVNGCWSSQRPAAPDYVDFLIVRLLVSKGKEEAVLSG